jgi:hypothetical protein
LLKQQARPKQRSNWKRKRALDTADKLQKENAPPMVVELQKETAPYIGGGRTIQPAKKHVGDEKNLVFDTSFSKTLPS